MLHSCKAATHSNPPAQPQTLGSTISASCGQPLHVYSLLQSSFAWAAQHLAREGGKSLGEAGLEGGIRAQEAVVASSTKRRQWMALVVSMLIGHLSFAHKSRSWSEIAREERRMARGGSWEIMSVAAMISIPTISFQYINAAMERSLVWEAEG